MATPHFSPEELQELHDLAARWAQIVSKRAFGDDGPGLDVDFRTFEQIATVAGCSVSTAFRRYEAGIAVLRQLLGVSCPEISSTR